MSGNFDLNGAQKDLYWQYLIGQKGLPDAVT